MSTATALHAKHEWRDFDVGDDGVVVCPVLKGELGSSAFEHGYAEVYLISGPEFDEAKCLVKEDS